MLVADPQRESQMAMIMGVQRQYMRRRLVEIDLGMHMPPQVQSAEGASKTGCCSREGSSEQSGKGGWLQLLESKLVEECEK